MTLVDRLPGPHATVTGVAVDVAIKFDGFGLILAAIMRRHSARLFNFVVHVP
jgi:hypothetical protein